MLPAFMSWIESCRDQQSVRMCQIVADYCTSLRDNFEFHADPNNLALVEITEIDISLTTHVTTRRLPVKLALVTNSDQSALLDGVGP